MSTLLNSLCKTYANAPHDLTHRAALLRWATQNGLYECECEPLGRRFSHEREHMIRRLAALTTRHAPHPIVLASHGPGGLAFEWELIVTLAPSHLPLDLVLIEPLQSQQPLDRAFATFHAGFEALRSHFPQLGAVHIYASLEEYATACVHNPHLRAALFFCIDADDAATIPPENRVLLVHEYTTRAQQVMTPQAHLLTLWHEPATTYGFHTLDVHVVASRGTHALIVHRSWGTRASNEEHDAWAYLHAKFWEKHPFSPSSLLSGLDEYRSDSPEPLGISLVAQLLEKSSSWLEEDVIQLLFSGSGLDIV